MNLLIHDLNEKEFKKIAGDYEGYEVVSDNGSIKPCVGCFNCWNKDPGRCVVKDGYENMGYLIHHADEVVVISKYTYGGFSGSIKNIFDRCLGYVLPHFELVNNETHHQKRYNEIKPFTFIFYGHQINEKEKECARRYVTAVCTNFRAQVKEVIFKEDNKKVKIPDRGEYKAEGKIVLLNASTRVKGNTAKLAVELQKRLNRETEIINLVNYLKDNDKLLKELEDVLTIVLCEPLYVDGLPSQLIRFMEKFEEDYKGKNKRIYALANMGLYESEQLINLFEGIKQWCTKMGFEYGGGLGVGAGELVGGFMEAVPFGKWPLSKIARGMDKLAEAINYNYITEDIYREPTFPRSLYMAIANSGWKKMAKANGLKPKDLYRQL